MSVPDKAAAGDLLRVLLVEDSADDAELITRALRRLERPLETLRVEDEQAFVAALGAFAPQLIVSDFSMPRFNGLRALGLAAEHAPGVPFLFVSGTIGEELAIEVVHRGAADYVLKDNLARLPSSARRVLDASAEQARLREAERALRASEERFRTVCETTDEWIWETDAAGKLLYSNTSIERLLGIPPTEVVGRERLSLMHPASRATAQARLAELGALPSGWRNWTLRCRHRDGSVRWLQSNASPNLAEDGRLLGFRGADRDITERVEREARLEFLAYHNTTTGLPNRTALRELLDARGDRGPLLVAALRLNGFYDYISSRGRGFAEQLLRATAVRLANLLPPDAIVAHLGEQSFAFAFDVAPGRQDDGMATVRRLERVLREEATDVDGEPANVSVRIGVALSPEHGRDAVDLERNAESALSETIRGNERVGVYHHRYRERVDAWIALERDLRGALARNEFELYFQPKYRVVGQTLCGAEALLRWNHPQRGQVAPAEFIPIAEQTGMIVELGEWVRRTAMDHAVGWRERGMDGLRIAVNLSARELEQPDFVERCLQTLGPQSHDQCLDLELTESLIMGDIQHSMGVLEALRGCGSRIAIDDFGTGYSSLNYLTRLPVDALKIDRSFVGALAQSADAVSMVSNVIQLEHSLGLTVIAEGVEDEEQAKLLRLLRCDEMQGYLISRPVPEGELVALLGA